VLQFLLYSLRTNLVPTTNNNMSVQSSASGRMTTTRLHRSGCCAVTGVAAADSIKPVKRSVAIRGYAAIRVPAAGFIRSRRWIRDICIRKHGATSNTNKIGDEVHFSLGINRIMGGSMTGTPSSGTSSSAGLATCRLDPAAYSPFGHGCGGSGSCCGRCQGGDGWRSKKLSSSLQNRLKCVRHGNGSLEVI
jgi:hypothetical protein